MYAYHIVSDLPEFQPIYRTYVGDDANKVLLDELSRDTNEIFDDYIKKGKKMIWDNEAKQKHRLATTCHICEKSLDIPTKLIGRNKIRTNVKFANITRK